MFMTLMAWHAMVIAPPCTLQDVVSLAMPQTDSQLSGTHPR